MLRGSGKESVDGSLRPGNEVSRTFTWDEAMIGSLREAL